MASRATMSFEARTGWLSTSNPTWRGGIVSIVVIEVRSLKDTLADVAKAMKGQPVDKEARIRFDTPALLWEVLTAKRWEILKALCGAGPVSIREAARRVARDVKAVHGDVVALLAVGVLQRADDGKIDFPFEAVKVEFLLQAA